MTFLRSFRETKASELRIGCTMQVYDADLDRCMWEHRGGRVGETRETVDHRDQDVAAATGPEFVHRLEPELGALGRLDPQAEHLLFALGR